MLRNANLCFIWCWSVLNLDRPGRTLAPALFLVLKSFANWHENTVAPAGALASHSISHVHRGLPKTRYFIPGQALHPVSHKVFCVWCPFFSPHLILENTMFASQKQKVQTTWLFTRHKPWFPKRQSKITSHNFRYCSSLRHSTRLSKRLTVENSSYYHPNGLPKQNIKFCVIS